MASPTRVPFRKRAREISFLGSNLLRAVSSGIIIFFGNLCLPAQAFQPNAIRLGTVEVHPSLATGVTYNSNISLTHDAVSDVIFREAPGVSLRWERAYIPQQKPRLASPHGVSLDFLRDLYLAWVEPRVETGYLGRARPATPPAAGAEGALLRSLKYRRFSARLDYEPQFLQLAQHPEFNAMDHNLSLTTDARFPGGLYLRLDDSFESSTAIDTYRNEVVHFSARERAEGIGYHTNLLSFSAGYNFYADYVLFASYLYQTFLVRNFDAAQVLPDLDFPPLVTARWQGINSGTLGLDLYNAQIYLAKQFVRRTSLSLGYVLGVVQGNLQDFGLSASLLGGLLPVEAHITGDPRNAVVHEVRAGLQRTLTTQRSILGWQIPRTALEAFFAYQWREFQALDLRISSAGTPLLTVPLKRKDLDEFLIKVKLSSQVREATLVQLSLSRYPQEAYGGSGNVLINWEAYLSLTQRIRSTWRLACHGAYRYAEVFQEPSRETDYSDYEAGANLAWQVQEWLQGLLRYQFLAREADFDYNTFHSHRVEFQLTISF